MKQKRCLDIALCMVGDKKPLIQVSQETKAMLDELGGKKDTYDSIIRRLLKRDSNAKK